MKNINWIVLVSLLIIIITIFSFFYLSNKHEPRDSPSKPESILSDECIAVGGEITNYQLPEGHDPYEQYIPSCSDDRENLGFVTDVNCLCICCK